MTTELTKVSIETELELDDGSVHLDELLQETRDD